MNPILPLDYLMLLLAAAMIAGGFLAWRNTAQTSLRLRLGLIVLRLLVLAGLGLIALNPGRWREQTVESDTAWALLVDRSLSMATPDMNGNSRWAEACRLAHKAVAAARQDSARIFTFAEQLSSPVANPERLAELKPDGKSTDIPGSVFAALNACRAGRTKLAGMLLLSDGRQVAGGECGPAAILARSQGSPILAMALGSEAVNKDLSIAMDRRQYVTFIGQKLKLTARVTNERMGLVSPVVELLDPAGKTVAEQKIVFTNDGMLSVSFEITPREHGYFQYCARLALWEGETRHANNEAEFGVAVLESKVRIFMAEGTPFWDSKFLAQLLRQQPNLELTSVYRLSSERFFKVETDASRVSSAGEPVFPDDKALANYDMVIFGRGTEYFLTPERIQHLKRFANEQGGCIIFARGKPYAGSFPDLEALEPAIWGEIIGRPFHLRPTQDGEYAGLFGDMLPGRNQAVWTQLPPLRHAHRCVRLKAFTHVLAEGVGNATEGSSALKFPLVFSQRYGKGVVVVVNAEDLWQWFFFPALDSASDAYKDFWIQLFTWAGTYSEFLPGRQYALHLSETLVDPDVPVRARIFRRSALPGKTLPGIRVMQGNVPVLEIATAATPDDEKWDAIFSLNKPGTYRVELSGVNEESPGGVYSTLSVRAPPTENDNRSADPAFLTKLAESSGGRLITENELEQAIRNFEPANQPLDLNKAEWLPLWNRNWLLSLLLLLFGLDFFLRRRNGLL